MGALNYNALLRPIYWLLWARAFFCCYKCLSLHNWISQMRASSSWNATANSISQAGCFDYEPLFFTALHWFPLSSPWRPIVACRHHYGKPLPKVITIRLSNLLLTLRLSKFPANPLGVFPCCHSHLGGVLINTPKIISLFILRFLKRKFPVFPSCSHSQIWQHCQAGGLLQLLFIQIIKILQSFLSDQFCLLSITFLCFSLFLQSFCYCDWLFVPSLNSSYYSKSGSLCRCKVQW